jgi:hypothetical protein
MKKNFYILSFLLLFVFGIQETFAQATINVTENFDTDPEWDGNGNTGNEGDNTTDYGYRNIDGVTGVTEGDYGCIGGIFCRTVAYSYYANTDLNGTLNRTMTMKMAGSMKLENRETGSFDGAFCIGYFDATNPGRQNFIGILIKEPIGATNPFRGVVGVNPDENTGNSPDIELVQLEKIEFDITFTGAADGSGVITGKLAGQDLYVIVPAGTGDFNSFGLLNGGMPFDRNERTRNCYFDDLTYTKISTGEDTYTISYDANGGTGTIAPDTKTHDVPLTLSDGSGFTREGYIFSNWNSSADGSGTAYAAGATYTENADITLYAIWSEVTSVDQNIIDAISIYPSMTTDRVYFKNVSEDSHVILVDISGRRLVENSVSELNGSLSMQPYEDGIYLIRVMRGHELVRTFKVLKK